jgi:hypothetical protein
MIDVREVIVTDITDKEALSAIDRTLSELKTSRAIGDDAECIVPTETVDFVIGVCETLRTMGIVNACEDKG